MARGLADVRTLGTAETRGIDSAQQAQANQLAQGASAQGMQSVDLGGGQTLVTAGPKESGVASPNFYDEPVVSALASLPSEKQAASYAGTSPSFYGIQRPGDYQRVVQREMAADRLPGGMNQLAQLIQNRITMAKTRAGVV